MNNNFEIYWKKLSTVSFDREITNGPVSIRNEQENDSKLASPAPITTHSIRLTDIILYPIKSCGGIYADSWYISDTGLLFDRHWMITNDDGVGLNQKREPKMTLVKPSLSKDFHKLNLSFEGCEPFSLEINSSQNKIRNNYITTNPVCQTKVCADNVTTVDAGDQAAHWVSLALNRSYCRLVSQINTIPRVSKGNRNHSNKSLSLANEEQYLLVSRTSIRKLLHLVRTTNPAITENDLVSRFRPNFVVDGGLPFEEDTWKSVTIGNLKFTCVGKCTRCQMICINQETGEKEPNILVSLRDIKENKITFGIYLRADEDYETEKISVGDAVTIQI
jgi:molybdenum cofactor sulfurtransferase